MADPPPNVDVAIEEVGLLIRNINRVADNIRQRPAATLTNPFLRDRLNALFNWWSRGNILHAQILASVDPSERLNFPYFANKLFDRLEQQYDAAENLILNHLDVIHTSMIQEPAAASSPRDRESINNVQPLQQIKLPRTELPKFAGDFTQWASFRDVFEAVIHSNESLSDIQKFSYLKSCLSGEASAIIATLSLTRENYAAAWAALKARFENNRILVNLLLQQLVSVKSVAPNNLKELKALRDNFAMTLESLKNINIETANWDPLVIFLLVQKLDTTLRNKWEESLCGKQDFPSLVDFTKFIDNQICTLQAISCTQPRSDKRKELNCKSAHNAVSNGQSTSKASGQSNGQMSNSKERVYKCSFCSEAHSIFACSAFNNLTVPQRFNKVKSARLCHNCLGKGHSVQACPSKRSCSHCNKRHHSLLHRDNAHVNHARANPTAGGANSDNSAPASEIPRLACENAPPASVATSAIPSTSNTPVHLNAHLNAPRHTTVLLATASVRLISRDGRSMRCRALIDQGSEATFVSESAAQFLKLKRAKTNVAIAGLGGESNVRVKHSVTFSVVPYFNSSESISVDALVLQKITSYKPTALRSLPLQQLGDVILADPVPDEFDTIDLLLGADLYSQIIRDGTKRVPNASWIAQNSVFGWILSGSVSSPATHMLRVNHASICDLDERLQKFWELEEVPCKPTESESDQFCEDLFTSTTSRDHSGRFVVRLPFRPDRDVNSLGESRRKATASFFHLSRRLLKNDTLNTAYSKFMAEYESLGHMSAIPAPHLGEETRVFLPHHGVLRDDKLTTKLRVVFNASSPTTSGVSLNDVLCIGPKLQTDITGILLNWRLHKYVLNSDIEKMFRQILVHPDDRRFQCILWRNANNDAPQVFELNTVTYGTGPAPYLAMRVVRALADNNQEQYPLAAEVLRNHIYVDDVLFGANEITHLREIKRQVCSVLNSGGLNLKKWSSNDSDLLSKEEQEELLALKSTSVEEPLKLLGVAWDPVSDALIIKSTDLDANANTKRTILSSLATLYDPLGWLSPIIIRAKCLMQSLWLLKVGWDDNLPDSVLIKWRDLANDIAAFPNFSTPRWFHFDSPLAEISLIGFCDASNAAYSAVVYLRVIDSLGQCHITLMMAKSKVAPLKSISIPRLELCGATLLKNLILHVQTQLRVPVRTVNCFSDSKIVLAWLARPAYEWTTFVRNRVASIQTELSSAIWNHVRSRDNPADLNSRGINAQDLIQSDLWWHGPEWLRSANTSDVAARCETFNTDEEKRKTVHVAAQTRPIWDLITRVSSWPKLVRIVAYVYKFLDAVRQRFDAKAPLGTRQIQQAKTAIIREVQLMHFLPEITALQKGVSIDSRSSILSLNPVLDPNGILRVGGRLTRSSLPNNKKFPIILPSLPELDKLIRYQHLRCLHGGLQQTLRLLRDEYWLVNARRSVKSVLYRCIDCARHRNVTPTQLMGDLPRERCSPSRPFSNTGIDYCGPLSVRISGGRGCKSRKSWIVLFVCLATRAIHIEIVSDYSAAAFLAALERFVARRGLPAVIFSDNGTTFLGANSEIRKVVRSALQDEQVRQRYALDGLEWRFIPPAAPHFGGLWEAGVKSLKTHLRKALTNKTPTFEELSTVCCAVEACLNSRPIAPLRDTLDDFDALTPGHFLTGTPLLSTPVIAGCVNEQSNLPARWREWQRVIQSVWRAWSADYLHQLQTRGKWRRARPNIHENDLVLLKLPNLPPGRWPLGRVTEVYPGRDDIVRVIKVRTADSEFTRPISQVCPLPINATPNSSN